MDEKAVSNSFDNHMVAPTEEGIANVNHQQITTTKHPSKSSISESYVIKHNTVK